MSKLEEQKALPRRKLFRNVDAIAKLVVEKLRVKHPLATSVTQKVRKAKKAKAKR